jgi:gluconate transporter
VAFIILAPIVWNLARESKKSILVFGLPVAAALTVTHALVPPHPAPAAAAAALGADLGKVILYGIAVSVPMAIVGGILYGGWIARRVFVPVPEIAARFAADSGAAPHLPPPVPLVLIVLLLPIALIFAGTLAAMFSLPAKRYWQFFGDPVTALALALLVAVLSMGFRRGLGRDAVTRVAGESLGPICSLLLITGAGGSFKQVITDCGVGLYAGNLMAGADISPLVVAYLIAGLLRIAQGSATVAIITAAGIVAPIVQNMSGYSPEILVLAIACGGTMLSHVNDSGFWIVNQYLGLSVPQTLRTWTVMKVIVSVVGFALVLAAQALAG